MKTTKTSEVAITLAFVARRLNGATKIVFARSSAEAERIARTILFVPSGEHVTVSRYFGPVCAD